MLRPSEIIKRKRIEHKNELAEAERRALEMRERLWRIGWHREVLRLEPGGLVTISEAASILDHAGTARLNALIVEGRIRAYTPEWGKQGSTLVPLDQLLTAPTPLENGAPRRRDSDGRWSRDTGYPYKLGESDVGAQPVGDELRDSKKNLRRVDDRVVECKSLPDLH